MFQTAMEDPDSIPGLFLTNDGGWMSGLTVANDSNRTKVDERASHAAEIPATNGITNARGLAGAYRPFALGGSADGRDVRRSRHTGWHGGALGHYQPQRDIPDS